MKMKISDFYKECFAQEGFIGNFHKKAVALHFGFGGWNELLFYSTTPKHKSIGTTSPFFQGATDDNGKIIMKMKYWIRMFINLWKGNTCVGCEYWSASDKLTHMCRFCNKQCKYKFPFEMCVDWKQRTPKKGLKI